MVEFSKKINLEDLLENFRELSGLLQDYVDEQDKHDVADCLLLKKVLEKAEFLNDVKKELSEGRSIPCYYQSDIAKMLGRNKLEDEEKELLNEIREVKETPDLIKQFYNQKSEECIVIRTHNREIYLDFDGNRLSFNAEFCGDDDIDSVDLSDGTDYLGCFEPKAYEHISGTFSDDVIEYGNDEYHWIPQLSVNLEKHELTEELLKRLLVKGLELQINVLPQYYDQSACEFEKIDFILKQFVNRKDY